MCRQSQPEVFNAVQQGLGDANLLRTADVVTCQVDDMRGEWWLQWVVHGLTLPV